jgi:N-acetylglucosaminyldiphosphoundecaprenol N-acetyl-beta-D-mannosaminyltransferase
MKLLDYNITSEFPQLPFKDRTIINTINPHSYQLSKQDSVFARALHESDVLLPDGIGIVWAAKILNGRRIKKIAGYDIFMYLLNHLNSNKGSCFFLGASDRTLVLIKEKLAKEFPNVIVNSYSPPYKTEFSKEDSDKMLCQVNKCNPEVLFVGMTAPKQEKWVSQYKDQLSPQIICSIGAVFDFYAGTIKRPGAFWIKLGMEWLPRFLKEPIRLAERNLISTPKFIFDVLSQKLVGRGF